MVGVILCSDRGAEGCVHGSRRQELCVDNFETQSFVRKHVLPSVGRMHFEKVLMYIVIESASAEGCGRKEVKIKLGREMLL